jgi:transposase-like protein
MHCPNCRSTKVQKKGKRAGKQRYRCTKCGANFTKGKEYKASPRYPKIVEVICPKCKSAHVRRDRILESGVQRYECSDCGLNFSSKAIPCDSEKTSYECPYCDGHLVYSSYIAPRVHEYKCSNCGHTFRKLPVANDYREKAVSSVLKGRKLSDVATEYNYSCDYLRRMMAPYYKNEKITPEQKKNIIRYGYYLNVPVDYMAEYIKCSEHKCIEVIKNFKKSIMSTTHDAT